MHDLVNEKPTLIKSPGQLRCGGCVCWEDAVSMHSAGVHGAEASSSPPILEQGSQRGV